MADDVRCNHCGSKVSSLICGYCGTPSRAMPSLEEEMTAVRELRNLRLGAPKERQIALLTTGFVPAHPDALVEEGLSLLPLLDDGSSDDLSDTAFRRLDSVVTRLRVGPAATSPRALPELEGRLARYRKADRNTGIMAITLVLVVLGLVIWGVYAFIHR